MQREKSDARSEVQVLAHPFVREQLGQRHRARGVPDGVAGWESVARFGQREEAALDPELDHHLVVEAGPRLVELSFGEELLRELRTKIRDRRAR